VSNSKILIASCVVLAASSGCAQLLGFEDVTAAANDAGPPDAAPDATDTLACAAEDISPAVGTTLGNTVTEANDVELSCGSMNSNDRLLAWRAPATDYYVFDTVGSSFDTVLGIFDECYGTELACNNNLSTSSDSEVVLKVELDNEVLVAVDGFAGDSGDFSLNVAPVSCPDFDLERQTLPLTFSTSGEGDEFFNECAGNGQEDRAFHWVAPTEGLYAFTMVAPGYRAVLSVLDGPRCSDTQLGCSQAFEADFEAQVVRRLSADQQVSVYADGVDGNGDFEIDIQKVETVCPSEVLPAETDVVGAYEARSMSSSCSFVKVRNTINTPEEMGDKTYQFEVPPASTGCFGSCDIQITSGGEFSAAVLEGGDCSGAELSCAQSTSGNLNVSVDMEEGVTKTHTLLITDRDTFDFGGFTLRMDCIQACA
jgi:hypothetical protein